MIVVGEHEAGDGYRYLHVPDLTKSTNDALVKRDVGTVATEADVLVYLCDDHSLHWDFLNQLRQTPSGWDAIIPSRWTQHPTLGRIRIPMGDPEYCGGHAGIFRRWVIRARPWTAMPHHRNWDVLASQEQAKLGARWHVVPQIQIEDLEPQAEPWR